MSDIAAPRTTLHPETRPDSRPESAPRTGGPRDRRQLVEQIAGWTLTVLVAMLITQLHWM